MIIHCTRKLAAKLPDVSNKSLVETSPLGSWHAHLLYFDRRQCVLFCHDLTRAILFAPGVRKPDLQQLGKGLFSSMLISMLYELGCNAGQLNAVKLALGPVQFDSATDRSVLASMTVAKHDLEPYIYDVANVLDFDPIAASARVTQRPATIAGEWIQPDVELLKLVHAL